MTLTPVHEDERTGLEGAVVVAGGVAPAGTVVRGGVVVAAGALVVEARTEKLAEMVRRALRLVVISARMVCLPVVGNHGRAPSGPVPLKSNGAKRSVRYAEPSRRKATRAILDAGATKT
jgi:hypothetical protein